MQGILETFEPVLSEVVVTRNASDRSMPVSELRTSRAKSSARSG